MASATKELVFILILSSTIIGQSTSSQSSLVGSDAGPSDFYPNPGFGPPGGSVGGISPGFGPFSGGAGPAGGGGGYPYPSDMPAGNFGPNIGEFSEPGGSHDVGPDPGPGPVSGQSSVPYVPDDASPYGGDATSQGQAGSGSSGVEQNVHVDSDQQDHTTIEDGNDTGKTADDSNTDTESDNTDVAELANFQQNKTLSHNSTIEMVEEDDCNYVGMYVTVAVIISFMVTLVAVALIRGPQGQFKTKRSDSEIAMMMAGMGLRDQSKKDPAVLEQEDETARTDTQWEQQPLQETYNGRVLEDEEIKLPLAPPYSESAPTTSVTTTVNEKSGDLEETI